MRIREQLAKSAMSSSVSSHCGQKSEIRDRKSKIEAEAYMNGTSQGPTAEDARKDDHIRGRSHARA